MKTIRDILKHRQESYGPLDRRSYSRRTLLDANEAGLVFEHGGRWFCRNGWADSVIFVGGKTRTVSHEPRYSSWRYLPGDTLWDLVFEAIPETGCIGWSITKSPVWDLLGFHRAGPERDEEVADVLDHFAGLQRIYFLRAGSVWEVSRVRDRR